MWPTLLLTTAAAQPHEQALAGAQQPPLIATCLAGAVRTFTLPRVWRSAEETLLRPNKPSDLFLVLETGPELSHKRDVKPVNATGLQSALAALQPVAVRLLFGESSHVQCGNQATGQFAKWAICAELIRAHEHGASKRYDLVLKARPDLLWMPPSVFSLARIIRDERLLQPGVRKVVSSNDRVLLLPRALLHVLDVLGGGTMECYSTCSVRRVWTHPNNEYCLLHETLKRLGIAHVEGEGPCIQGVTTCVDEPDKSRGYHLRHGAPGRGYKISRWAAVDDWLYRYLQPQGSALLQSALTSSGLHAMMVANTTAWYFRQRGTLAVDCTHSPGTAVDGAVQWACVQCDTKPADRAPSLATAGTSEALVGVAPQTSESKRSNTGAAVRPCPTPTALRA